MFLQTTTIFQYKVLSTPTRTMKDYVKVWALDTPSECHPDDTVHFNAAPALLREQDHHQHGTAVRALDQSE